MAVQKATSSAKRTARSVLSKNSEKPAPRVLESKLVEVSFNSSSETVDKDTHSDTRLGFLMHDITRMRRAVLDQMMKKIGVTRAQWWVIAHLSRHDGMMQVQLASMLDIGKASLGNLAERLDAGGWIERRDDPIDKRAKRIYLTRKARQLIDQLHAVEFEFNELALHGLSRDDRTKMLKCLSLVKDNLLKMTDGNGATHS